MWQLGGYPKSRRRDETQECTRKGGGPAAQLIDILPRARVNTRRARVALVAGRGLVCFQDHPAHRALQSGDIEAIWTCRALPLRSTGWLGLLTDGSMEAENGALAGLVLSP